MLARIDGLAATDFPFTLTAHAQSRRWDAAFGPGESAIVSYLLLRIEFVFWIGFGLPFGPPLGVARTILLLLA